MGPGGIATIIAACALFIIAIALSYVVIRVGRFVDEAKLSLKSLTDETSPLIEEVHTTVMLINGPLQSINRITKNAEDISDKIAEVTSSFINKKGAAVKIAGALLSVASAKKSRAKKKAE